MRIGVQLPEAERAVRWPEVVAMADAAEKSGFDSIWLGDHLLYRGDGRPDRGPHDVWTQLAALAAVTKRVTLGPLVTAVPFYAPGILARMAASVDEVSGGRLVLGVGAGWNEAEFRAFGFPFDSLVSRFAESFEIVRRLLAGERVTFSGRFYSVDDAVLLPTPARRIPLMIGSNGARMLAITLPHVAAHNTWYRSYGNTTEGFATLRAQIDGACTQAGREQGELVHSACVLVSLRDGASERPHEVPAVPAEDLPGHLRELAKAGADEAILVLDPITERSIRETGEALRVG
jgi:alkanesulfonate monooxygenase SsuD/methylene tetrahydromethanopterin reductase-like flavin-dependent oxidoreductase (luciferase family)